MAQGNKWFSWQTAIADDATVAFQPGASVEVSVHNIVLPQAIGGQGVELEYYDGTNSIVFEEYLIDTLLDLHLDITNTNYLRVTNRSGAAINVLVTGVETTP